MSKLGKKVAVFEQHYTAGLYLTGQDIMTCGVVGAMIDGLLTAVAVSGLRGLPLAKKMFVG